MQKKKKKESHNHMYTQQLVHLPDGMTPAKIVARIEEESTVLRYAMITHDKDVDECGNLKATHIHLMMQFKNQRSCSGVAKLFNDNENQVTVWDDKPNVGFLYLIHANDGARHQHQYDATEVIANFDFTEFVKREMQKKSGKSSSASNSKINKILDLIAIGELSIREAKSMLSGAEYAFASTRLEKAHALYLEREADKLLKTMRANNETSNVYWLYGPAGSGKTHIATEFAKDEGNYYITTSAKDPFEYYEGQAILILDELRPKAISYPELLSLLNPYGRQSAVSSRYHNKKIACRTIYITTPYSPKVFYQKLGVDADDIGYQLYRRLTSVLRLDMDFIYEQIYDSEVDDFIDIKKKKNEYSEAACNRKGLIESSRLFDDIPGESYSLINIQETLFDELSDEDLKKYRTF